MTLARRRVVVHGRVQGVWFREHGPAGARVDSVEVEELPPTGEQGFAARR